MPQFVASPLMAYKYLVDNNKYVDGIKYNQYSPVGSTSIMSRRDYFDNSFIVPLTMNLKSKAGIKFQSGYMSAGLQSAIFIQNTADPNADSEPLDGGAAATGSAVETMIICEFVSLLTIGAGRMASYIV